MELGTADIVFLAIGACILLFMFVHWAFIGPWQRRKYESRMMVLKVSTIFHLRGRDDLAEEVMNAKDIYEVQAIVRRFEIERGKRNERTEAG